MESQKNSQLPSETVTSRAKVPSKRPRSSSSPNSSSTDDSDVESGHADNDASFNDSKGEALQHSRLSSDIRHGLHSSLQGLTRAMCFASSGPCPMEVNPCISIRELGIIGLPLSERDAKLISSITHAAPYGRESETIVDTTVRQTRELDADLFELKDPKWNAALEGVIHSVAADLDVPGGAAGIRAIPYKMLLYEKGSKFKQHRDSEKQANMFGTLVICLPSKHEGGEIHVTHGGKRKILETAESSEFGYTYLCWYADVKHEVMVVTSGYRLVLIYNLINTNLHNPAKAPPEFDGKEKELGRVLSCWKDHCQENTAHCPTKLVYILDHLYTKQALSLSGLKGGDRLVGHCLSELCKKYGFLLYLAEIERGIDGDCEDENDEEDAWKEMYWRACDNQEPEIHHITQVNGEWLKLQDVVDPNGTKLLDMVPLQESEIVQEDPFEGQPDEEDFTGPTGGYGVSATHFYHRSLLRFNQAAVLVPLVYLVEFYFQSYKKSKGDMSGWLDRLIQSYDPTHEDESSKRDLEKACHLISRGTSQYRYDCSKICFSDRLLGKVIRAGLRLNDRSICCEALGSAMTQLPQPETVEIIDRFGFEELQIELNAAIQRLMFMDQRLFALIRTYSEYGSLAGRSELTLKVMLEWVKDRALDEFYSNPMTSKADGNAAAEVGILCGKDYLVRKLIPALEIQSKDHRWTYTALLAFLSKVHERVEIETAKDVFSAMLHRFIPCITLAAREKKRMRISKGYIPSALMDPDDMIRLFQQCVSLRLELQVHQLFDKLEELAEAEEPAIIMKHFFIPFTGKLHGPTPLAENVRDRVSLFTVKMLNLYANRCVGPKPTRPMDWRRAKCGCGCEKCLQLDYFLDNPSQEEIWISAGTEDDAKHLTSRLPRIDQGSWRREVPEYETQVELGFELRVRKTENAWSYAVKTWEEDREAAQKLFDEAFDDEEKRESLKVRLEQLGSRSCLSGYQ